MDTLTPLPPAAAPADAAGPALPGLRGVLAAASGLAAGELAAGLLGLTSPVLGVGDVVVDIVPEPVKRIAIAVFGTADKVALQVGILVLLVVAAVGLGRWAVRARRPAVAVTIGVGALGIAAVLAAPESRALDVLPSAVATVVAATVLWVAVRATGDGAGTDATRRHALRGIGSGFALAGLAALGGGAARRVRSRSAEQARSATALPTPVSTVTYPDDVAFDVEGLSSFETSLADFYRIDTRLDVPRLSREDSTLTITGMVDRPVTLRVDELEDRYEVVERAITLTCVSNEVGGQLLGTARWRGVLLADVLADVGVDPAATQLVGRAFDDWTAGFPVEAAFDRDAMLVTGMNGEPLPAEHGYPLRLIVPGLYGYVSATKWLVELELTTFDAFDQYWVERGWSASGPIRTQSRIDTPRGLTRVQGVVPVAGVAWAQTRGIERVEVRVDDGPWQEAELAAPMNDVTWRQWLFRWDTSSVTPGRHDLTVRATDRTGATQPEERRTPFPDGATGWHRLAVTVAGD